MPKIKLPSLPIDTSYDIQIGFDVFGKLPSLLQKKKWGNKYAIITDSNIKGIYGDKLLKKLRKAGIEAELFAIRAGEKSKDMKTISAICSKMIRKKFDRKSCIIALGGGVAGDFAGFVASIFMRGIPYIQAPTSLLAMVDSAVGGKTGVDIPEGKNLIGSFYNPETVLIDLEFLKKLPKRQLQIGLAEAIKYGVIWDKKFFEYFQKNTKKILRKERAAMSKIISTSVAIKAEVVTKDFKEGGLRRILNYGHTYGHAIECLSKYKLTHGEAISIGMHFANFLVDFKDTDTVNAVFKAYGLPISMPKKMSATDIYKCMLSDKKTIGGDIHFVVPKKIGTVEVQKIDPKLLKSKIKQFLC